jgi:hypothetical protein
MAHAQEVGDVDDADGLEAAPVIHHRPASRRCGALSRETFGISIASFAWVVAQPDERGYVVIRRIRQEPRAF